jgi:hypothetical protein
VFEQKTIGDLQQHRHVLECGPGAGVTVDIHEFVGVETPGEKAAGFSYFLALELEPLVGWRWTIVACGAGPLVAFFVAIVLVPRPPKVEHIPGRVERWRGSPLGRSLSVSGVSSFVPK